MDKTLAEIYGTNQVEEADVEKLAAAELAEQLTETGDAQIDDETLEALAEEVLAQEDGSEEQAAVEEPGVEGEEKVAEAEEAEVDEETQEKLAEADYLGRIMAHAFVQESREIEKQAMEKVADDVEIPQVAKKPIIAADAEGKGSASLKNMAKQNVRDAGGYTKNVAGRFGTALAGGRGASGVKERILGKAGQRTKVWGARGATGAAVAGAAFGAKKLLDKSKEKKSFAVTDEGHKLDAAEAGASAKKLHAIRKAREEYSEKAPVRSMLRHGIFGDAGVRAAERHADYRAQKHEKGQNPMNPFGGMMTKSRLEKKSSAVDTLAEQRALEVLAEAGYDVDAVVNAVQEYTAGAEQEKVSEANPYDVLAETVEARAEEMLSGLVEAGIIALPEEQEQE